MTSYTSSGDAAINHVSVVVCTRNHRDWLCECLDSIAADSSRCAREIIVVDNGSTDGTPMVVKEFADRCPHPVLLVVEDRPGLSRARNAGVRASRGEIVIFTDDDVCVSDGWIDALTAAFKPGVAAVGGRILPDFLSPPPNWMEGIQLEYTTLTDYGSESFEMRSGRVPVGANMAVRHEVLTSRPMAFDERLGHRDGVAMGFEERHLLELVLREHRIVYAPKAIVHHRIREDRLQYARLRRGFYQGGFGLARYERMMGDPVPSLPRRAVRAWRTCNGAKSIRRRVARMSDISPQQAEEDFLAHMWAGKTLEMLFGRFPRLATVLARRHV